MKRKFLFAIGTMLLLCSLTFAQNGGIPVEIKPLNPPPYQPPFGGIINPNDSDISGSGNLYLDSTIVAIKYNII